MDDIRLDHAVYEKQSRPLKQQIAGYLDAAQTTPVEGEVYALIVPNTNRLSGARAAADVFKVLEGRRYDTVILVAAARNASFPRMNICEVDAYPALLGTLAVNDRLRHELCDEDDDIYLDDDGHFEAEGIAVQLPYLQTLLGDFDIVPVVMGEESPEFCRELGNAIGEVTFNKRILVVASVDVVGSSEAHLAEFQQYFEAGDVSRLMMMLNSERVHLAGKGPFLVTMIAAAHRHIDRVRILSLEPAHDDVPGYLGAVICQ